MRDFPGKLNQTFSPGREHGRKQLQAIDWSRVKGVILDLDGVFYPETRTHNANTNLLMAQSIRDLASQRGHEIPMRNDDLVELGLRSYEERGHSMFGFQDYLDSLYPGEYDLRGTDWEVLHHLVHDAHIELAAKNPGYFEDCKERQEFFAHLSYFGHDNVAILTHGSKNWARAVVGELDLQHIFDDDNIYALECVDFNKKNDGPEAFEKVCWERGLRPDEMLFIDNTESNHFYPKGLGIQTIFIQGDNPPFQELPDYVDGQAEDLRDVGQHLKAWIDSQKYNPDPANSNTPDGPLSSGQT